MAKSKFKKWLEPDNLMLLSAWARNGLIDEQIAHNIGISRSTLSEWKLKYPIIADTLKKSKEIVDIQVENALFNKALGYNAKIKKTFKLKKVEYNQKTGKRVAEYEELVEAYDEVHVPADTTAQIYWLKNRKPAEWRDRGIDPDAGKDLDTLDEMLRTVKKAITDGKDI